jgi:putative Ig domain-containing protein
MRVVRLVLLVAVVGLLPLAFTGGASALDLCEEPHCQPPAAEQNTPFEWEFIAEEGCVPYRFSYVNGTVTPGLRVTPDGKLVGTPTASGTFEFWVTLNDNGGPQNPACLIPGTESQSKFTHHVMPDLAVTTESLPLAAPGQPYRAQLAFSNPEAGWPVIWDIKEGSPPQGITLSADGVLSGTPAGPDVKTFVVRAREPFRRFGERQLTLTVGTALQATSAVRQGEVGVKYSGAIRATGGVAPLAWSIATGPLPDGLSLNRTTGRLSGVPRAAGATALTFAVTDAAGQQKTVPATIRIAPRLAITTAQLPGASVGQSFRARLVASGGVTPKRWSIARGTLPRGIRLDRATGVLSGVPKESGTFALVLRTTDRLGGKATKKLRLSVSG